MTDLTPAIEKLRAGQLQQAEEHCRHILSKQHDNAQACHLLGIILAKKGNTGASVNHLRRAIAINPDWAEAHYDLANALQRLGQSEEAIASYRLVITLRPHWPEAHNNLGALLTEMGRTDEAVTAFEHLIALRPADPMARSNLGNALRAAGKLRESIAAYRTALSFKPYLPEALNNLAVALKEQGSLGDSLAAAQDVIRSQPTFAEAHNTIGVVLEAQGKLDEAIIAYERAIALRPGYAEAHYNLGNVFKATGQLQAAISAYRQAIAIRPGFVQAQSNLVYAMHFKPASDAQFIAEELRRWNHQHAAPLTKRIQPLTVYHPSNRRLRIGYVSPDLSDHPVGRFLQPLLANHDKKAFEIFAYAQVRIPDAVTDSLRSPVDHWRDITHLSDARTADLIRQDQIDILIDLTMHMAHNRLLVFARKPAPLQVTWLAYCSSTGLNVMDYRISDPHLDPPDMDETVYTEKTIRLPETYWCYQPPAIAPAVGPLSAVTQGHITFGSLNTFCKVNELTLSVWSKLLRLVPGSRLVIHAPVCDRRQYLLKHFNNDGIESSRISFVAKVPPAHYFRLYHTIDIALDTFPYGGGTTTCDALWMGVPVVSLVGDTAVGRGGLSILSNIGLPELAATNETHYIRIATDLAADQTRLANLRSTLRQRMQQSSLMDAPRFARNIESVYRVISSTL